MQKTMYVLVHGGSPAHDTTAHTEGDIRHNKMQMKECWKEMEEQNSKGIKLLSKRMCVCVCVCMENLTIFQTSV